MANLRQQITQDQRVQALAESRRNGSIPGEVSGEELQAFGYDVPPDWNYRGRDARMPAHVYDGHDKWDTIMPMAGGTVLGYGLTQLPTPSPTSSPSPTPGPTTVPGADKMGMGDRILDFLGGDNGFSIDDLIKAVVTGKGIKDMFGGGDEEAEWATFENESRGGRSLDPRDTLAQGMGQAEGALGDAQARAKEPIRLRSSFVQQPPQFFGGGLPMPIGLTGMDPALVDPDLLKSDSPADSDEEAFAALEMLRG